MADLKSKLLKEIYLRNYVFEGALKATSFPKEDSYKLSQIAVRFDGRHSKGEQLQAEGNLLSPPPYQIWCLPAPSGNLIFAWHTQIHHYVSFPSKDSTAFFLPLNRNRHKGAASTKLNFLYFSLQDLLYRTLIQFSSNVALAKFWNVPPSAHIPLTAMTWQAVLFFIII